MTNNELLLAMSDMMETKLKAEVRPLRNEMYDMEQRLESKIGRASCRERVSA